MVHNVSFFCGRRRVKGNTFFPKNSIESIKTGKITQTPWGKEAVKDIKKADACISTKVSSKKNLL